MKISHFILILICFFFVAPGFTDTFVNLKTGETLHGYAQRPSREYTSTTDGGERIVHTREKGRIRLDLKEWQIKPDRTGRNNQVISLSVDDSIMLQIETEALVDALGRASDKGPLFILLQIDTPGGRVDYTKQICSAIIQTDNCKIIGLITGKKYGGALSAGTALALSCESLYMTPNSVIGAAAPMGLKGGKAKDFEKLYGEKVAEKISSAWRSYLSSLAERNSRPGLLAAAMVEQNLEVIEISKDGKRHFIEPINKSPEHKIVHTWSKKGSLLTLTARSAVKCGIADKVIDYQGKPGEQDKPSSPQGELTGLSGGYLRVLLKHLDAEDAELVIDDAFQKAGERLQRAKQRFKKTSEQLDLKIKRLKTAATERMTLALLRDIRDGYKSLVVLSRLYPDLEVETNSLKEQLNSAEALYKEAKMRGRLRR